MSKLDVSPNGSLPMSALPDAANIPLPIAMTTPLPVLRVPMLDRERQLFAYEITFHREPDDEQTLLQRVLSTLTDGALTRLVRGNRAFLNLPTELLPEDSDVLLHQPRIGLLLQPQVADNTPLMKRLQLMSQRGCQLMLDAGDLELDGSLAIESLMQIVQFVRLDARAMAPETLRETSQKLHDRGIWVIAGQVDDHTTYQRCLELPLQAIQGRYLLIPQGSRILGKYNSQVSYGQRRVQVVWNRIILPDTSSLTLDNLAGADPAGYAGLEDGVDWHWSRIFAGAAMTTLLGVGAELAAFCRVEAPLEEGAEDRRVDRAPIEAGGGEHAVDLGAGEGKRSVVLEKAAVEPVDGLVADAAALAHGAE